MRSKRFFCISCALALIVLFAPSTVYSQTITLNGPSNVTLSDSDEYFSDVWGKAKNYDSICDIGFDGGYFRPKSVSNGIWTGTHPEFVAPKVGPIPIPTFGSQLAYREDCGRLGIHLPVNADKYTQLSYKSAISHPGSFSVMWSNNTWFAVEGFADIDGYLLNVPILPGSMEFTIKDFDMKARDDTSNLPWTGNVTGLQLWPSFTQPAGGQMSFDWLRLTDPATSPKINFSWTTVGASGTPASDRAMLYVDDNNSGYDGILLRPKLATSSNLEFNSGSLPPGTYYFYTQLETNNTTPQVVAQSNYIGPVTINGKPDFVFRSPTRLSGPEYSRDELGNPWDMSDSADITNTNIDETVNGYNNASFHDGVFEATSYENECRHN